MKKTLIKLTAAFACAAMLFACSEDGRPVMKHATGKPGEIVVVIPKSTWDGAAGDTLFHFLAQPVADLPREEPMLNVVHIPPKAFSNIFKISRNILRIKMGSSEKETSLRLQRNVWSKPQLIVTVQAPNEKHLTEFFARNGDQVVRLFTNEERDRLVAKHADPKYNQVGLTNRMMREHHFAVHVPKGFTVARETNNFVWMRYQTPEIDQSVLAYWYPYTSDSTFTKKYLLDKRDSVLKENVPGNRKGTYMETERRIPAFFRALTLHGNYSVLMRGLWRVHGDFMGGPFVSLTTLDQVRGRVLTLEGYVYAPRKDKRELVRQLEAMIYSVRFPDPKKNAPINRLAEVSNDTSVSPVDSVETQ